ncbi:MAG: hypothetical protein JWR81_6319 [Pseudonocardia sp.]|jgi:hypothetical protein|nr:hypothetical protein [Pseudonocardia sp.]MDT7617879.1 hypothetical protein [Pseudonocardiales bacterium]
MPLSSVRWLPRRIVSAGAITSRGTDADVTTWPGRAWNGAKPE